MGGGGGGILRGAIPKHWATKGGPRQKFACSRGVHPKINEHLGNFAATIDVQQTYMTICLPPPLRFSKILYIYTVTDNTQLYSIAVIFSKSATFI